MLTSRVCANPEMDLIISQTNVDRDGSRRLGSIPNARNAGIEPNIFVNPFCLQLQPVRSYYVAILPSAMVQLVNSY